MSETVEQVDADLGILELIKLQVEFYLGDANLPSDKFLLKNMVDDKVRISTIASFKRIKKLTDDPSVVVNAIKLSDELLVSDNDTMVGRRSPLPDCDWAEKLSRTVSVHILPANLRSIDAIKTKFSECGEVLLVRVMSQSTGKASSSRVVSRGEYALVEYSSREQAERAVVELSETGNWRSGMRVALEGKKTEANGGGGGCHADETKSKGKKGGTNQQKQQVGTPPPSVSEAEMLSICAHLCEGHVRSVGRVFSTFPKHGFLSLGTETVALVRAEIQQQQKKQEQEKLQKQEVQEQEQMKENAQAQEQVEEQVDCSVTPSPPEVSTVSTEHEVKAGAEAEAAAAAPPITHPTTEDVPLVAAAAGDGTDAAVDTTTPPLSKTQAKKKKKQAAAAAAASASRLFFHVSSLRPCTAAAAAPPSSQSPHTEAMGADGAETATTPATEADLSRSGVVGVGDKVEFSVSWREESGKYVATDIVLIEKAPPTQPKSTPITRAEDSRVEGGGVKGKKKKNRRRWCDADDVKWGGGPAARGGEGGARRSGIRRMGRGVEGGAEGPTGGGAAAAAAVGMNGILQARGPDGSRGFAAGRGRPICSVSAPTN